MAPSPSKQSRSGRLIGRGWISGDERLVLDLRPSLWMIIVRPWKTWWLIGLGLLLIRVGVWATGILFGPVFVLPRGLSTRNMLFIGIAAVILTLAWSILTFAVRRYVLTDGRVLVVSGVLHQRVGEIPISRVQNVSVSRPPVLRLLGLGHIGLASAGTMGYEVVWGFIGHPERAVEEIRKVMQQSGGTE